MSEEQELLAAIRETNDLLRQMLQKQAESKSRLSDLIGQQKDLPSITETFEKTMAKVTSKLPAKLEVAKIDEIRERQQEFQNGFVEQLGKQTEMLQLIATKLGVDEA